MVNKETYFSNSVDEPVSGLTIITKENKSISIYEVTFQVINDTVHLSGVNNINTRPVHMNIAIVDIQSVEVEKYDSGTSTGLIIGLTSVLVVFLLLAIAAASSTPKSCGPPSDFSDWD
jgi:hypothetical protein